MDDRPLEAGRHGLHGPLVRQAVLWARRSQAPARGLAEEGDERRLALRDLRRPAEPEAPRLPLACGLLQPAVGAVPVGEARQRRRLGRGGERGLREPPGVFAGVPRAAGVGAVGAGQQPRLVTRGEQRREDEQREGAGGRAVHGEWRIVARGLPPKAGGRPRALPAWATPSAPSWRTGSPRGTGKKDSRRNVDLIVRTPWRPPRRRACTTAAGPRPAAQRPQPPGAPCRGGRVRAQPASAGRSHAVG